MTAAAARRKTKRVREGTVEPLWVTPATIEAIQQALLSEHGGSAFAIARTHPFVDGNKRTAFQAMYVFLGLNGKDLDAEETEVVDVSQPSSGCRSDEHWSRGNESFC